MDSLQVTFLTTWWSSRVPLPPGMASARRHRFAGIRGTRNRRATSRSLAPGRVMTAAGGEGRISRKERIARATVGMPAGHPELVTRKPGRAEWTLLAAWCAELWPHDEYTAIVAEAWREDGS